MVHEGEQVLDRHDVVARITRDHAVITGLARRTLLDPLMRMTLTLGQLKVLLEVVSCEGSTTHQLAGRLGVSAATTSVLVDKLVDRGLVERQQDEVDRRVKRLRALPEGEALVRDVVDRGSWMRPDVLDEISSEDLAALAQGLTALRAAVEHRAVAPAP